MRIAVAATAVLILSSVGVAQEIVMPDMNSESAWTIIQDNDASAEFGFDYSVYGIPPAPNGDDALGIRTAVNINDGAAAAISLSPNGVTGSGRYVITVDAWLNYYIDPEDPTSTSGTTEYAGVTVGVSGQGDPLNGGGLIGSSDGDAAQDYVLLVDGTILELESEQYFVESLNHTDVIYQELFISEETPDAQVDDFDPPNGAILSPPGSLAFAWHEFRVEVDTDNGEAIFSIDDLEIGFLASDLNLLDFGSRIALNSWDRFSSVAPVSEFAFTIFDNLKIEYLDGVGGEPGDFDSNGALDIDDLDALVAAVREGSSDSTYDVDGSGDVDLQDVNYWVGELKNTWLGDANLDGEFNSADFVATFTEGQYEDAIVGNSTWATGDWNADGEFDSADFVAAFTEGGYEQGPRTATAAVPEPTGLALLLIAAAFALRRRR